MRVSFSLGWGKSGKSFEKAYSFSECASLVSIYTQRISEKGFPTNVHAGLNTEKLKEFTQKDKSQLWICHPAGKITSSEEIALLFEKVMGSSQNLCVAIGGDNGFSASDMNLLKPNMLWSFGKLTLPHEMASVVAAEQIYRALSILRNEPYHRK